MFGIQLRADIWPVALCATTMLCASLPNVHASADNCTQEKAVYEDVDGVAELAFVPPSGGITESHAFELRIKDGPTLNGGIIWNMGVSRPNGFLTPQDCGSDDVQACTLWEGVVYTISSEGELDLIDEGNRPAAEQIVLPDLSRTLHYSALRETVDSFPWEAFQFARCRTD
ncbi:MAG: hypothetical protein AAFY73_05450 [Pseudomonadota bacterium]